MVPYVSRFVPTEVMLFFRVVSRVIEEMDYSTLLHEREVSCHILARAILLRVRKSGGSTLRIRTETGYFNGRYEHSWLRVSQMDTPEESWIIDVYPVGAMATQRAGAILWDCSVVAQLYAIHPRVARSVASTPNFRGDVHAVGIAVAETKQALGL